MANIDLYCQTMGCLKTLLDQVESTVARDRRRQAERLERVRRRVEKAGLVARKRRQVCHLKFLLDCPVSREPVVFWLGRLGSLVSVDRGLLDRVQAIAGSVRLAEFTCPDPRRSAVSTIFRVDVAGVLLLVRRALEADLIDLDEFRGTWSLRLATRPTREPRCQLEFSAELSKLLNDREDENFFAIVRNPRLQLGPEFSLPRGSLRIERSERPRKPKEAKVRFSFQPDEGQEEKEEPTAPPLGWLNDAEAVSSTQPFEFMYQTQYFEPFDSEALFATDTELIPCTQMAGGESGPDEDELDLLPEEENVEPTQIIARENSPSPPSLALSSSLSSPEELVVASKSCVVEKRSVAPPPTRKAKEFKEPMQQFIDFRPIAYDLSTRLGPYHGQWGDMEQFVPATQQQQQQQAMRLAYLQQQQQQLGTQTRSQYEMSQQLAIRINEKQMITSTLCSNPAVKATMTTTTKTTTELSVVESSQMMVQRRKMKRRMFMQIGLSKKQRVKNPLHASLSLN